MRRKIASSQTRENWQKEMPQFIIFCCCLCDELSSVGGERYEESLSRSSLEKITADCRSNFALFTSHHIAVNPH